ncbi:mitochondrial tRNA methylthiotransferase CDK5RAP1 [Pyxicephalus adspersus]|uniref:mitochondrial tRNA methylthiotransferase CDK5RAP1 n=1 Tax=Pyxicephalus adspersus TaxID=30357 RepID=UPI003B58D36B
MLLMEPLKFCRLFSRTKILLSYRFLSSGLPSAQKTVSRKEKFSARLAAVPHLKEFIANSNPEAAVPPAVEEDAPHYIADSSPPVNNKVYFETYGCQMNVNDTEIAWSILQKTGYVRTNTVSEVTELLQSIVVVHIDKCMFFICYKFSFSSIMRGCDNMCTYCIVPFTRGRERSRPVHSILEEIRMLSDQGIKEVTLLGQNVNSYLDKSSVQFPASEVSHLSRGFSTVYKPKKGGLRFADLLDQVSRIDPEMRIRFTSPHPKDFPDEVLHLIKEKHNICKQIHIPAQSGSNKVLEAMRRGYTREAYIDLINTIREHIPGVSLSSDFITGFCQETEEDHQQTISLLKEVSYNSAFLFAYSMRKKTRAYHRMNDDVPEEVKKRRLEELIAVFREEAERVSERSVGSKQLVLVEGVSKRSSTELCGRNDGNIKVIFPDVPVACNSSPETEVRAKAGDYVLVQITSSSSQSFRGRLIGLTSLQSSPAYS